MARFAVRNELGRYIVIVSRLICHFLWLLNVERLTIFKNKWFGFLFYHGSLTFPYPKLYTFATFQNAR